MPSLRDPPAFAVYRVLRGEPARAVSFTELRNRTGRTARVVSYQLHRLIEAGLVVRRPGPRPGDRRSRWLYQAGAGWPWIEQHERVMRDVSRAISDRRVYYSLAAGARDPGPDGVLVYNDLIVETGKPLGDDTYPSGVQNARKVEHALKAVRQALKGEDPEGYHWQFLLRRVIAEVVTSQSRPYFLLSYPATGFGAGHAGSRWPDLHWKEYRLSTATGHPGRRRRLRQIDTHLYGRFGLEYAGFIESHRRLAHAPSGRCRCSEKKLERLLLESRKRRMRSWSRKVRGLGERAATNR